MITVIRNVLCLYLLYKQAYFIVKSYNYIIYSLINVLNNIIIHTYHILCINDTL